MPIVRARRLALPCFVLVFAAAGCAGMADSGAMFQDSHRRYTRLVRFGEFERAKAFVAPESRDDYLAQARELGDLRFSDYEIRDVEAEASDRATVRVEYVGYRPSSAIMVTYVEEQLWERQGGAWTVHSLIEEKRP